MKDILPISGTWFDFFHCNPYEGDYWNSTTNLFSSQDWEKKIEEMAQAGMDTFLLLSVALHGKAFYPSEVIKLRWNLECHDSIEAVLKAADRLNVKMYMGLGFFTTPAFHDFTDDSASGLRSDIAKELVARYGSHPSFAGWYLPVEAGIQGYYPEGYIPYVNKLSDQCRKLGPYRVIIAPYGARSINFDQRFTDEVKAIEADNIAYQDEIGVARTTFDHVEETFKRLREVHDRVGKPLWADMEVFQFQGKVLIPAPFARVRRQLEILSEHVDKILCYQYLGMMNKPGSPVHAGHETSVQLYKDYMDYLKERGVKP
jgi:hypothetical protein